MAVFTEDWTHIRNGQTAPLPLPEPRKLRGLRFPVIPTGSLLAQVGGGVAALTGTWMQFGTAVALMVGGVAAVVLGALRESGQV